MNGPSAGTLAKIGRRPFRRANYKRVYLLVIRVCEGSVSTSCATNDKWLGRRQALRPRVSVGLATGRCVMSLWPPLASCRD